MRLIDKQYLHTPWYGARQMMRHVRREGYRVGRKRISRLMRLTGLTAIYPKASSTSRPHPQRQGVSLPAAWYANQSSGAGMDCGYQLYSNGQRLLYLVAIMDWASRKVLSWRLSNTLEADFCIEALKEALKRYGAPAIFNTDQGSQFTSDGFIGTLQAAGIHISMDGKGSWRDNVMIERLWRSLKYECVYLHAFAGRSELRQGLKQWINYYNSKRPHSSLDSRTPDEAYWQLPLPGYTRDRDLALAA